MGEGEWPAVARREEESPLFDALPPHRAGHETQRAGAVRAMRRADSQMELVYEAVLASGRRGLTDREIQERTLFEINVVSARRNRLYRMGRIGKVRGPDEKWITRRNESGVEALVWAVVEMNGEG